MPCHHDHRYWDFSKVLLQDLEVAEHMLPKLDDSLVHVQLPRSRIDIHLKGKMIQQEQQIEKK